MSVRASTSSKPPAREARLDGSPADSAPAPKLSIGIVNAFGGNRGDEAMLCALVEFLQSTFAGVEITIYAKGALDLTYQRVDVTRPPRARIALAKVSYRLARLEESWRLSKPSRLQGRVSGLREHDFIISAPAGPYLGDLNRRSNFAALLPLACAQAAGTPFGIVGTSSGPFVNARWNRLRRRVLSQAEFWSVREPQSASHIETLELGIPVLRGADLVFGHPIKAPDELSAWGDPNFDREREHLQRLRENGPVIAVTLNKTDYLRTDGRKQAFDFADYVSRMQGLLAHVLNKTGGHVVLFPHFYGEDRQEQRTLAALRARFAGERVSILHPYLNSQAQRSLYRLADFALSHRYHPTIFAITAGCPFLCIRHQFKTDGMLGLFDDPGPVVKTDDSLQQWKQAFDEAWSDRNAIRAQIQEKLPDVERLSRVHYDALKTHVERCLGNPGRSRPGS